jgi:hypothetical protein
VRRNTGRLDPSAAAGLTRPAVVVVGERNAAHLGSILAELRPWIGF